MKRVPDLNSYRIPTRELERLMDIVRYVNSFVRHDIRNPIQALMYCLECTRQLTETNPMDLAQLTQRLALALQLTQELTHRIDTLLPRPPSGSHWRVSEPYPIAQDMLKMWPEAQIAVHPRACRTLKVLYPASALSSMVNELVRNAQKHTRNASICLVWRLAAGRFRYSVHDAGQGIVRSLPTRYVPLEFLELSTPKEGGLFLIRRIASTSGGLTLIRRSPILGGTEVCLDLPVSAYCMGRSKRERD